MQMTSKLEELGRKAAIINKTKGEDVGRSPGLFARGDGKDEAPRRAEIQANKKATRSSSRSPLRGREGKRKQGRKPVPPGTPETRHKR